MGFEDLAAARIGAYQLEEAAAREAAGLSYDVYRSLVAVPVGREVVAANVEMVSSEPGYTVPEINPRLLK